MTVISNQVYSAMADQIGVRSINGRVAGDLHDTLTDLFDADAERPNIPQRNCILEGPVDATGVPILFSAGTGLACDLKATVRISFANGFVATVGASDYYNSITSDAAGFWASLPINSTVYLYFDRDSSGVVTGGYSVLAPVYQSFAPTHSSGLHWFDTNSQKMFVSNGSAWTQVWRVFVGTATTDADSVTAISVNNYVVPKFEVSTMVVNDIITKGPWVDVRAFGAVGDGLNDDFSAIKQAIESEYPVILIPDGIFKVKITSTIVVPQNKTIIQSQNSKILVDQTTGEWYCFLQSDATNLNNVTIDGLKFDSNTANNTGGSAVNATNKQYIILFNRGSGANVTIQNCVLKGASENIIMVNAQIYNTIIANNRLEFVLKNTVTWYDNTALYISCFDYICCNNFITTNAAINIDGGSPQTGLEIHSGRANVFGNIIDGFIDGSDIVSTDYPLPYRVAVNFHDNIIDSKRGLNLWNYVDDLENVNIHHNNFICEWSGILHAVSNGGVLKDSIISENYIFFPLGLTVPPNSAGEAGISLYMNTPVRNLTINNNTIVNPQYLGIMLAETDTYVRENIIVCGNTIINPCSNTDDMGNFKDCFFIPYTMTGVISNNKILNPNKNWGRSYRGIGTHVPNVDNYVFANNQIPHTMTFSLVIDSPYSTSNEFYGALPSTIKSFRSKLNPIYCIDSQVATEAELKGLYEVGDVVVVGTKNYTCITEGTILDEALWGGGTVQVSSGGTVFTFNGCENYPIRSIVSIGSLSGRIIQNIFGQLAVAANLAALADGTYSITYSPPTWAVLGIAQAAARADSSATDVAGVNTVLNDLLAKLRAANIIAT